MSHRVVFSPEAQAQLTDLYRHIAQAASPTVAARYTEAVIRECEGLAIFPLRGRPRDDVRPGLRTTHHKGRTVIAFSVTDTVVSILGVFYGGQNYEPILHEDELEPPEA